MLATSPSSGSRSTSFVKGESTFPTRTQYDNYAKSPHTPSQIVQTEPSREHYPSPIPRPIRRFSARSLDSFSPPVRARRKMVDAGTQYSPPQGTTPHKVNTLIATSTIAGLKLGEKTPLTEADAHDGEIDEARPPPPAATDAPNLPRSGPVSVSSQSKRHASDQDDETRSTVPNVDQKGHGLLTDSPAKRARPEAPAPRIMPSQYETCDTRDLVILIASMLMELIRYNDGIPLREGHLTRFHSRAPPGISVQDYLQRLTTHATLSPPILLSMVYYIDKLCALYPAFTISSLTVHRVLITTATVASKGLSDSFWTNKTYARVGGVSIKELALLELEFLTRTDWRIVPKPEVLCDYYKSLVKRNSDYQLEE